MGVRHDDELSSEELEQAAGGLDVDAYCPTTNSGCNMVAGCGGGTKASLSPSVQ
ncbi:MAG TPA: hypothetical protein VHG51_16305 [Longimicrobiaceae bacterium]|nr:hypothetical protein [Longimicrobiaceae bacterium]